MEEVHAAGLELEVVESVNVHEDIKMGLPTRDEYIANYISTIRTLAKYGVKDIRDLNSGSLTRLAQFTDDE